MFQITERAVARQLQCAVGDRMKQVVKPFHHGDSRGVGHCGDPLCLRAITRERLLGQHRLTRSDGRQIPRRVHRIGQRVVHDVDLGVIDHLIVGRQNALHAVLFGEQLRPLGVTRRDGDQSVSQLLRGPDDGELGDPRRTEHADLQAGDAHTGTDPHRSVM